MSDVRVAEVNAETLLKVTEALEATKKDLAAAKLEIRSLEAKAVTDGNRIFRLEGEWGASKGDVARLQAGNAELSRDRDRWRRRAETAEAVTPAGFQELEEKNVALRTEISRLHQIANGKLAEISELSKLANEREVDKLALARQIEIERGTLITMQNARDAAERVTEEERAHRLAIAGRLSDMTAKIEEVRRWGKEMANRLDSSRKTVIVAEELHRKTQHPKAVPTCPLCIALDESAKL